MPVFNDRKKLAQFILLMFITMLLLYVCWLMLLPFITVLLWSAILVIIFHPLYSKLMKKFGKHAISAIITIAAALLTFIIPFLLISLAALNELASFTDTFVDQIQIIMNDPMHSWIGGLYNYLDQYVHIKDNIKPEDVKEFITRITSGILSASWYLIEGFFGMLVGILFSIFAMFYLFRDGEKLVNDLPGILPMENDQARELIKEVSTLIDATIRGSLFVAVIQGILAGLIFWILGVPSAILLGVLAMIFSLVPTGGTAFVTVPAIVIMTVSGEYWKAGILAAYAALVIGMVDNFLLPKLIKQRSKMNELFVFFSVLGGLQLFGILGIFMGPIILAIAIGLLNVFKGEKLSKDSIELK